MCSALLLAITTQLVEYHQSISFSQFSFQLPFEHLNNISGTRYYYYCMTTGNYTTKTITGSLLIDVWRLKSQNGMRYILYSPKPRRIPNTRPATRRGRQRCNTPMKTRTRELATDHTTGRRDEETQYLLLHGTRCCHKKTTDDTTLTYNWRTRVPVYLYFDRRIRTTK